MNKYEAMSNEDVSLEVRFKWMAQNATGDNAIDSENFDAIGAFSINNWADMGVIVDEVWCDLMHTLPGCGKSEWLRIMEVFECSKLKAAVICYLEI